MHYQVLLKCLSIKKRNPKKNSSIAEKSSNLRCNENYEKTSNLERIK